MTRQEFLSKPAPNEDVLTADTHLFLNNNYPQLRGFYFHIPNESATNKMMRIKLFSMGILPGVPDIMFLKPYTWLLELKMPNGTLSPKQKALHQKWKNEGIIVETAYSKEQIIAALEKHLQPCLLR
jgi:hypothetical protein